MPLGCPHQCHISPAYCLADRHTSTAPLFPPPQGVFAGGVESAAELVRRREADPREFMLLAGYSGWGPWQLQRVSGRRWGLAAAGQVVPQFARFC